MYVKTRYKRTEILSALLKKLNKTSIVLDSVIAISINELPLVILQLLVLLLLLLIVLILIV